MKISVWIADFLTEVKLSLTTYYPVQVTRFLTVKPAHWWSAKYTQPQPLSSQKAWNSTAQIQLNRIK
jgi:hypothetical protein